MRTIITGGSGVIGKRLVRMLNHEGYDVVVLSRNPDKRFPNPPDGVRVVKWDAKTPNGWLHLLDHPDTAIINLAGESIASNDWTEAHKARVLQSRLDVSRAVVAAIHQAEHKPYALLQASAVGYYADHGDEVITEHTPPSCEWRAQVCVDWEQAVADASIRTVIMRIGIALDTEGGALPAFIQAANMMGSRLGSGRQWIPWIHNDDIAGAIRYLMNHHDAHGVFNVVSPNSMRNADFMRTVAHVRGRPALIPVPAFALNMVLGEQAAFVLDSQHVSADKLLKAGYHFHFPDAESALRDLLRHAPHWKHTHS